MLGTVSGGGEGSPQYVPYTGSHTNTNATLTNFKQNCIYKHKNTDRGDLPVLSKIQSSTLYYYYYYCHNSLSILTTIFQMDLG